MSEPDEDLRVYTHQEGPDEDADEGPSAPRPARRTSTKSFVTASSVPAASPDSDNEAIPFPHRDQAQASGLQVPSGSEVAESKSLGKRPLSTAESTSCGEPSVDAVSTTSLLRKADSQKAPHGSAPSPPAQGILVKPKKNKSQQMGSSDPNSSPLDRVGESFSRRKSTLRNLVKFDIPEDSKRASIHFRAKQAQMTVQRASTKLRRKKIKDGLIVKMERMLVRVDEAGREVPDDFDENGSQKIDSRVKDKWREYMVVCRHSESEDADFVLQIYKTRVSSDAATRDAVC